MNLSDLILEFPSFMSSKECEDMIKWFHDNKNLQHVGGVENGDVNLLHKKATQIHPQIGSDFWCKISVKINEAIDEYYKRTSLVWNDRLISYTYSIRCYDKNDGWFKEHVDISPSDPLLLSRLYAIIIYLNTVDEGGDTEFLI